MYRNKKGGMMIGNTNLIFNFSEKALNWVKKEGNVLTVDLFESATKCCVGSVQELQVRLKEPSNPARYSFYQYDGIHIFVEKSLVFKNNQLDFQLSKIPFFKGITVSGLKRF